MDGFANNLSIIAPLVILFLILVVLLTILYLVKRNGFYISVNCWFCNEWTKVLYADRNSFHCPFCKQYNGFNDDGGYNKVIEAQFDTSFNKQYKTTMNVKSPSNGLCNYCNNNQQLKVRQLASFVPLNEKNYDMEIEHFRTQLEKSYKLCKLCDKVLKKKLEKQHAWIFGNHIKNIKKRISPKLNKLRKHNTSSKKFVFVNILRCFLILCALIVLCQAVNVRINHPKSTIKEYIPEILKPYTVLFSGLCHIISNVTKFITENVDRKLNIHLTSKLKDIRIINNDILPITWLGLVMEILLLTFHTKPVLWKANELLGWIILVFTSLNIFRKDYFLYLNTLQVLCSIFIIYGLCMTNKYKQLFKNKKFAFKKLKTNAEKCESSDEDVSEDTSTLGSNQSFSEKSHKFNNSFNVGQQNMHSQNFLFQNLLKNTADFNNTFVTARNTRSPSAFNNSFRNNSSESSSDELHHSLDNLHLSNRNFKPRPSTSPAFSVNSLNRPILSPPKLKNITQNSWTAGGFWKSDVAAFSASTDVTNLSRSSSQSSGFMSSNEPAVPHMYNSLPSSREHSLHGDFEKASILSEPAYHFTPINSSCSNNQSGNNFCFRTSSVSKQCVSNTSQLYYKADNNTFYPVLKQNNMLLIQGNDIPRINFESSFSNLSLKSFNTTKNGFNTPVMFGEKPVISSLFKNIKGVSPQSHTFRAPQF